MIEIKRRPEADTSQFTDATPPLLQRIYASRGISCEAELERGAKGLLGYNQLFGIQPAVDLLVSALAEQRRIIVVGDFDADGAPVLPCRCWRCVCWAAVTWIIWCPTVLMTVMV
ncbi:single-stranded-DNA-specific exonuclease RecJ [Photobacterium aphoticum]|uniref:Single-stranded-DNA-specific exonuclease RecJ n=1 Tax=Photobacterium aphoticum TaxID=754436 RepID=A0A090QUS0_9GAMM|nr:single-stranded-DNA-specific exonuclease RecJ [Photobacterium aphoticum]